MKKKYIIIFLLISIILLFLILNKKNKNKIAFYTVFIGSNKNKAFKSTTIPSNFYDCYYYTNNKEIIESLPANIIFDIKKFYENLVNVFNELVFTLPSINENVNLNPFDSSLLEILKLLFRANLKNIYEMQYFMVSKMHYTPEYIDNNTFVENVLLLRLFEDELKKQDELAKKPKQQGMPLMPGKQ